MILNQNRNFDEIDEQVLEARYNETALEQLLENNILQQRFAKIANKLCAIRKHVGMEAPEDIQQEINIRIIEKIHMFRGEAKFTTWAERIAINIVIEQFKKVKKRNEFSIDDDYQNNEEIADSADSAHKIDVQLDVKLMLEKLPSKLRNAVCQHFLEGKSFRHMAETGDYNSPQTAANYVKQAIKMLRSLLKINFEDDENLRVSKIH
jgi:RNA polymerase sigma-70 factor (ECF subfamily)